MPVSVNLIKKAIIKKALKEGKSARRALQAAGAGPGTVHNSTNSPLVKQCINEIQEELRLADITPDYCAKTSNRIGNKAENGEYYSAALRAVEFQAELAGLINRRENSQIHNHLHLSASSDDIQRVSESIAELTQRIRSTNQGNNT